ncbi:MAG: flavin reductase [Eubacteriales bacterium]|nr:flavin reductase [Eubacteriales bacterium]
MAFREIKPEQLPGNVVDEICNKWMLLAAGTPEDFNFMTVNWGMIGELWFQPAVTVYVRDSRHTLGYVERAGRFTLTRLKDGCKEALAIAGSKSGRDIDKIKETGLTPVDLDGAPSFEEAAYTIVCETMYQAPLEVSRISDEEAVARSYPEPVDAHQMFIGKIVKVYQNEE